MSINSEPDFASLDSMWNTESNLVRFYRVDTKCRVFSLFSSSEIANHGPMIESSLRFQPSPSVTTKSFQKSKLFGLAEFFSVRGSPRADR